MSSEILVVLEENRQAEFTNDPQTHQKSEQKEIYDDWDIELTTFVSANEHELVDCPWQPGVEMTLSAVTLEWHIHITPITAENVDSILAELRQLLANKKTLLEETPEDELALDLEDNIKLDDDKSRPKDTPKPVSSKPKEQNKVIQKATRAAQTDSTIAVASEPPVPNLYIAPITATTIDTSAATYESTHVEPVKAISSAPIALLRPKAAELSITAIQEPSFELSNIDSGPITPQITEQIQSVPYTQELNTEITKDTSPATPIDTIDAITPLSEAAALPNDIALEAPESDPYETETQHNVTLQAKETLAKIAESAQQSDIETTKATHEIVSEIIEVALVATQEIDADIEQAKEDLVALYAELLEVLNIIQTPELLESLALMTLQGRYEYTIKDLEDSTKADESKQNSDAVTVTRQLTATLAHIKDAMAQACAIGKSAIWHYNLSFIETVR